MITEKTWSENWRFHSEEIKQFMPEIQTAQEMFDTQFINLIKLIEVGRKKIENAGFPKRIRIIAFTHENLFTHWLSEYWNQPGLNLGEMVCFRYDENNNLIANVRGEKQVVSLSPKVRKKIQS